VSSYIGAYVHAVRSMARWIGKRRCPHCDDRSRTSIHIGDSVVLLCRIHRYYRNGGIPACHGKPSSESRQCCSTAWCHPLPARSGCLTSSWHCGRTHCGSSRRHYLNDKCHCAVSLLLINKKRLARGLICEHPLFILE